MTRVGVFSLASDFSCCLSALVQCFPVFLVDLLIFLLSNYCFPVVSRRHVRFPIVGHNNMLVRYGKPVKYRKQDSQSGLTYRTHPGTLETMNVGKKIQTLRVEKGLSLPQLAEKAGVSKGFVFQIEDDEKTNPSLETLNKIAKALDVTLADLLEKETVLAKRIVVVPDDLEPSLREFIDDRNAQGQPVDTNAIQALYVLQHRKGKSPKTKEDWRYVYESIERVFKRK